MFEFLFEAPLVTGIIGAVVLLILVVYLIVKRIAVAGPNEAFIITGRKGEGAVKNPETGEVSTDLSGQKVVMGASVFVLPFIQKLHILDLSSRRISVRITGAVSQQGIKTDLDGVAVVKVGGNEDAIRAAAQRFLAQQGSIEEFTQEVLAGSLRAIVGRLTVDEIIKDRAAFASAVAEEAETSLTNQGLTLDTFQLQDIQAEGSYLEDLGRPEAARVQQDAEIAEARARQQSEQERLRAEEEIAVSERQLELKKAEIKAETDEANAQAAAAGPLREAARNQEVVSEQERVAEREASLRDRQLDAEVRRPAEAERYRVEQEAEGQRNAAIYEAEAERERRAKMAEATELEGRADAEAIRAKGEAEAEARRKNAEAFQLYGDAAVIDLLTSVLPDIVRGASEPLSEVEKMTVISTDGASSLTKSVANNLEQGLQVGSDLTGIDLRGLFSRLGRGDGDESALREAAGAAMRRTGDGGNSAEGEEDS
ncbi:flotillin family protein [Egibacter rhizosphaerae]|uniref:Flotillin family protein n=1 Tax=Egibacter rhizosphaerae TaxID=1670831 RepID=A0A411YIS7_9ACTN|nr:flotillin family protein [Egibacter rhizosphaerae]QBI21140.1 flotillin family protein [Egibacter rhizosphaerae]